MIFERIDKLLASQGTASRSDVKKLIYKGRVTVNGAVIKQCDYKVNTDTDVVAVDGDILEINRHIYLMMNKPAGVVCATKDKVNTTVIDLIASQYKRKGLFPVGRLDKDTEGLLIITDDGHFAHRVTSPRKKVYKTYHAVIDSNIDKEDVVAFEKGIVFKDGTVCEKAFLCQLSDVKTPLVEVKICEGMFHQVKKMLLTRGKTVLYLKRVAIGNLKLDNTINKGGVKQLSILDINNIFVGEVH